MLANGVTNNPMQSGLLVKQSVGRGIKHVGQLMRNQSNNILNARRRVSLSFNIIGVITIPLGYQKRASLNK